MAPTAAHSVLLPTGAFSSIACSIAWMTTIAWTSSHGQCLPTRVAGSRTMCSPPCLSVGRWTSWRAEANYASAGDVLAASLPVVLLYTVDGKGAI
ncbi:hypothetical protein GUJ93_ZPchr0010g10559 [Zizania palustris]|uniref:Uncharacterized protein n=1 Tax=Zizania palustris TaxID=103762 RepID=A0A8J5WCU4_ZIZPA|nr:hypothetical protein GUJ93_ZPchr0010g10559 [Zizania palustris]